MGVGNRPAACASCGKRLSYKSWYYRNGQHFCKRRCWETEVEKTAKEAAKQAAEKSEKAAVAAAATASDKPKDETSSAAPAA